MPDHTETLKAMLQDIINDRHEEATATMHDYFLAKTREVAKIATPEPEPDVDVDVDSDDTLDAE